MTRRPETTPESAADRRLSELLDSVRVVFAAKGFDGASMQDLAQAAGMSAGNFYRYFPSKDAIIAAMVERDLAEVEKMFSLILNSDHPAEMLRAALDEHLSSGDCDEGAIWAEIIAAASRRAEVGAVHCRMEEMITGYLVAIFGRIAGVPGDRAEGLFRPHATMLFTLVQGLTIGRRVGDDYLNSPMYALVHRVFDTILADVAANAVPARPHPLVAQ
jgi:AcrR family transcriptional regulator